MVVIFSSVRLCLSWVYQGDIHGVVHLARHQRRNALEQMLFGDLCGHVLLNGEREGGKKYKKLKRLVGLTICKSKNKRQRVKRVMNVMTFAITHGPMVVVHSMT